MGIDTQKGEIFIAEDGDQIIGFAACIVKDFPEDVKHEYDPFRQGEIIELFVLEEYRGKHVGSKLFQHMEDYCKESKCDNLGTHVFAPNESAVSFYKVRGFSHRSYWILKPLGK